jgi:hypothetical protein
MSRHGAGWFYELDGYYEIAEERRKKERELIRTNIGSSSLSYLSLGELQRIIFKDKWAECFAQVFKGSKTPQHDLLKLIMPVRNKIAHFRPVSESDRRALDSVDYIYQLLREYYTQGRFTEIYLSTEPSRSSELMENFLLREAEEAFRNRGMIEVWNEFLSIDWLRAYSVYPGIGLFKDNAFIEFYCQSYNIDPLLRWLVSQDSYLNCVSINDKVGLIRIFIPLVLGEKLALKSIKGVVGLMKEANAGTGSIKSNLGWLGQMELVNNFSSNNVCFAF